jgi:putative membrane protein
MKVGHSKRRPRVAGDGENLPLEIVRCLSEWYSVLEDRGTVAGGFY